jgi:hypothetical protein
MNFRSFGRGVWRRLFNRRKNTAAPGEGPDLLVVRPGMSPAFHFFCQIYANERGLKVVSDRRAKDRRRRQRAVASTDRRRNDRRQSESGIDFWVVKGTRTKD